MNKQLIYLGLLSAASYTNLQSSEKSYADSVATIVELDRKNKETLVNEHALETKNLLETLQQKIQSAHTLEEKITLIDKIIKDKAEITERYSRSVVETNQNSMAAIVVAAKKEEDNFLNSFNAEK